MKITDTKITVESENDLRNPDGTRFIGAFGNYYVPDWDDPLLGPKTAVKTSFGVTMSAMMSQFYSMINHHRIALSSFSTDNCVLREMPKLVELEKKLLAAGFSPQRWEMVQNLRNIMKRIPANRTATGNRLQPEKPAPPTTAPTTVEAEARAGIEPNKARESAESRFSLLEID